MANDLNRGATGQIYSNGALLAMESADMDSKITHADLVAFADDKVNIKPDDLTDYRAQVRRVRERLETYINDHPDFDLVKMRHPGSVAKGLS